MTVKDLQAKRPKLTLFNTTVDGVTQYLIVDRAKHDRPIIEWGRTPDEAWNKAALRLSDRHPRVPPQQPRVSRYEIEYVRVIWDSWFPDVEAPSEYWLSVLAAKYDSTILNEAFEVTREARENGQEFDSAERLHKYAFACCRNIQWAHQQAHRQQQKQMSAEDSQRIAQCIAQGQAEIDAMEIRL